MFQDCPPLPDFLTQSFECAACLGDSVVDLGIDGGCAREGAAEVGKGLDRLKSLSIHCDLRLMVLVAWGWLEHHLSLFSADGEAEVVAGCRKAEQLPIRPERDVDARLALSKGVRQHS